MHDTMTEHVPTPILLAILFFSANLRFGNTCNIDEHGGTDLRIFGTQKTYPYTKFLGIEPGERKCLKSLYLELVEFDPDYLVDQLKGCEILQSLILKNTHWSKIGFTKKVHLPNLTWFSLYLRNWDFRASSAEEILSFYFVYRHPIQDYSKYNYSDYPRALHNYSLNKFIPSFNFSTHIYLVTSAGERTSERTIIYSYRHVLHISELPFDVSSYFEFPSLTLSNTVFNVSSLKEIQDHFSLNNVKLISGRISDVFAKSPNARTMYFGFSDSDTSEKQSIDLAELPRHLSGFGFSYGSIWNSDPNLHLTSLNDLRLEHCELNLTMPKFAKLNFLTLNNVLSVGENNLISFIKDNEHLKHFVLNGLNTFDLSALEPSRDSLFFLSISNTPVVTQSGPMSLGHCEFRLNNSVLDTAALKRFPETFKNIKILYMFGDFEFVASLLLVAVQTQIYEIYIYIQGDQRIRSRPEFEKTVKFLKNVSVPPYSTSIYLLRNYSLPQLWEYRGDKEDYRDNPYLRDLAIYSYTLPLLFICFIGILGNLVSGVVLMSKEMRGSNSYILLGLTVCDTMILLTYISSLLYFGLKFIFMFREFSIPEYHFPLFWFEISLESAQESDNMQTLFLYPLNKTAYTGSVHITVLVTLERYVAVCLPLRSKRILKTKKAVAVIVAVIALSTILNIPRWLEAQTNTLEKVDPNTYPIRWKIERNIASTDLLLYTAYREFYHGWIWVTMMYGIPIPLLIGLNIKIWMQLKEHMANMGALRSSRDQRSSEELASLTKTLICVSTIFIICNAINGVVTLLILWNNPGDWEPADIEIFSCIPLIVNSSINFGIYCVMGKKFRETLLNLLRRYFRVCWNPFDRVRSSLTSHSVPSTIEMRSL